MGSRVLSAAVRPHPQTPDRSEHFCRAPQSFSRRPRLLVEQFRRRAVPAVQRHTRGPFDNQKNKLPFISFSAFGQRSNELHRPVNVAERLDVG